jgi:hypothetical protein
VGPDEPTSSGVIQCWRAKDRVLNRDVAVRVHTPAGPAAHAWISRALTAGGLATPALAMVYDASEGNDGGGPGDDAAPGGAAYVVNEWIDGETLADRLTRGPLPEREIRTVLRRLAEGVAEAHRVGLAVGGLTLDNVVLRPNGLVGLRAVPAATGTIDGDVTALGALLEACLTGLPEGPGPGRLTGPSDLVALARRARSTEAGQGLSSVAAMVALLAERPRTGPGLQVGTPARAEDSDSGRRRRLRDRRGEAGPTAPAAATRAVALSPAVLGGDTIDAGSVTPAAGAYAGRVQPAGEGQGRWPESSDEEFDALAPADDPLAGYDDEDPDAESGDGRGRHRLVVVGLPLLALAVVIALAWWLGTNVLSVAGSVDQVEGSTPSGGAPTASPAGKPATGAPTRIVSASVFDPEGDGEPENDQDVPLAYDGDPSTAWSTLTYRGSPAFGNLKSGVGLLLDLGDAQALSGVTVSSTHPGATVEIRTGEDPGGDLGSFTAVASGTLEDSTDLSFEKPATARYVLVWITGLVDGPDGFSADLAEVVPHAAA